MPRFDECDRPKVEALADKLFKQLDEGIPSVVKRDKDRVDAFAGAVLTKVSELALKRYRILE